VSEESDLSSTDQNRNGDVSDSDSDKQPDEESKMIQSPTKHKTQNNAGCVSGIGTIPLQSE